MYCSLIVSQESAQKLIAGNGLEAHFAEVYLFQFAGFLQMAKAGVWNMLSYFIHNTHVL